MNLSRALAGFLESSTPKKWALLRPSAAILRPFSTLDDAPSTRIYKRKTNSPAPLAATDPEPDASLKEKSTETVKEAIVNRFPTNGRPKRPTNIPFQAQVANAVHLVGKIGAPIQTEISPNGVLTAISVLVNEKRDDFPRFWIPVIFPGDLAQIAACYLHEDNLVYITGQLSGDGTPVTIKDATANIQVLARSLSFVKRDSLQMEGRKVQQASKDESVPSDTLWKDLLSNPDKWWDNRESKYPSASFKHKDNGQVLLINNSTPEWVLSKLDMLSDKKSSKESQTMDDTLWNDLLSNPDKWWDNRKSKNYPSASFKHKDNGQVLLINNSTPKWVLSKLDMLSDEKSSKESQTMGNIKDSKSTEWNFTANPNKKNNEGLWKALVDDPNKWWDNRSNKLTPKSPDFKHKDSGDALWLGSSTPSWVLPKLPPTTANANKQETKSSGRATVIW